MQTPNHPATGIINSDVQREHQFDMTSLATFVADNEQLLTAEQRNVNDQRIYCSTTRCILFSKCTRWHWKKFLFSLILAHIRSENHIALAIASSGISAILLDGGRTAHSALKLPLNVHSNPDAMCSIKKHSGMAEDLKICKIVIWDECAMAHKHSLEALDKSLKYIKNNTRFFVGALMLMAGDFRQI
ncbi:ATP-dependent DNA helicase [Trichonephila clavipes]|nr:ATP-dependent DNA helicase [Trichonephila clavipes]